MLFSYNLAFESLLDITPDIIKGQCAKGIILDIDNTCTTHDNPVPIEGLREWVAAMQDAGIKLIIVSNNHEPRVRPFAELIGLDFVCEGAKPLPKGYIEGCRRMGIKCREGIAIGDQIYTDILGANLCGMRSILLRPIEPEKTMFFKFKRWAEKPFLPKVYRRG
ncbi:MAG: YqeG family HAD IIIA-type phosphatase [Oscillospiraceae bacterium]|nr:YqeG family HAD IIIA-type phosphatase [Oscillospiraceae bacterium]